MDPVNSMQDAPPPARLARALASPLGVLIILPLLVVAVGVGILLLGRRATRDASDSMARRELTAQAIDVQHDVAFALDQAEVLLARLRPLAVEDLPIEGVGPRLHDLVVGRPGVTNVSLAFPTGVMRGTYQPDGLAGEIGVQESRVGDHATQRRNYRLKDGALALASEETTAYDPRTRPHYTMALAAHARLWMPPRTFFTSHTTGMTCVEPLYGADGALRAVITVDFDVGALSAFISRAPLDDARTVMFSRDGTILAFPSAPVPAIATQENRLLRHGDYHDPALEALFGVLDEGKRLTPTEIHFFELTTNDGGYLASVAPVGGQRAGIGAPIDWYLATLVPTRTLLGPTHRLELQSAIASGGALAAAVGVALMFAWNLVRMRRQVAISREAARSAEAKARELGSYRLVSRLGAGGMGEVWRAEHRLLARQAAIKLVRAEALLDPLSAPKVRERFRREAQTLASMRSQHTIALFDYGVTDDGTFFYVMELLDGLDLDGLVRHHGAQPPARVIHLLIQACQSLAEAHEAGLMHRDIKPANLFTCRAADEVDVLKVLDFGIVHTLGDDAQDPLDAVSLPPMVPAAPATPSMVGTGGRLTQAGALVGTPGYIPPEQAYGMPIDGRSDLYALGCVAWWLLTSSEVFPRPDEESAILSHVHDPVPALRPRVRGWLPPELEAIIQLLLAKQPDDRPANARVLIDLLRAVPIPAEHAWDERRAQSWWYVHRPRAAEDAAPAASGGRLLIPQRAVSTPDAVTAADRPAPVATISARRSR